MDLKLTTELGTFQIIFYSLIDVNEGLGLICFTQNINCFCKLVAVALHNSWTTESLKTPYLILTSWAATKPFSP